MRTIGMELRTEGTWEEKSNVLLQKVLGTRRGNGVFPGEKKKAPPEVPRAARTGKEVRKPKMTSSGSPKKDGKEAPCQGLDEHATEETDSTTSLPTQPNERRTTTSTERGPSTGDTPRG